MLIRLITRPLILLLMLVIVPTTSISENTYKITSDELREINLIFAEHDYLSAKVPLLEQTIENLHHVDSLRTEMYLERMKHISELQFKVDSLQSQIESNKRSIKLRNYGLLGCGCVICTMLLLL